jgi:hypothetical protein
MRKAINRKKTNYSVTLSYFFCAVQFPVFRATVTVAEEGTQRGKCVLIVLCGGLAVASKLHLRFPVANAMLARPVFPGPVNCKKEVQEERKLNAMQCNVTSQGWIEALYGRHLWNEYATRDCKGNVFFVRSLSCNKEVKNLPFLSWSYLYLFLLVIWYWKDIRTVSLLVSISRVAVGARICATYHSLSCTALRLQHAYVGIGEVLMRHILAVQFNSIFDQRSTLYMIYDLHLRCILLNT